MEYNILSEKADDKGKTKNSVKAGRLCHLILIGKKAKTTTLGYWQKPGGCYAEIHN